jgi:hypothetical protein
VRVSPPHAAVSVKGKFRILELPGLAPTVPPTRNSARDEARSAEVQNILQVTPRGEGKEASG